jgi:four helix bundle protein
MATFTRFEEIDAWISARELSNLVHAILKDRKWQDLAGIKDQIYKASGSVMDNIAEGFERDNNNEFLYFLAIAKASCGEVRSQVYRLNDFGLITASENSKLMKLAKQTSSMIAALMRHIKSSPFRGNRKK